LLQLKEDIALLSWVYQSYRFSGVRFTRTYT